MTGTATFDQMFRQHKHLLIVSGPGGGKSTIASWVVGQSSRWWSNAVRRQKSAGAPYGATIAVYVHANDLVGESLEESIALRYLDIGLTQLSPDDFRKSPLPGVDWLVFVDGVDELLDSHKRSRTLNLLSSYLTESRSPMRLVITSRPLSTGELAELHSPDVGQMYLQPFDRDDIREFAQNWFIARRGYAPDPRASDEVVEDFINCVRRAGLGGMMRVPLLVAMAALVYEKDANSALPSTRGDLYREYISLLLSARHLEITDSGDRSPEGSTSHPSSFSVWMSKALPELLLVLAVARVEDAGCSLMHVGRAWVRERLSSDDLNEPEWPWIGSLQSALISTSVLEAVGSDIEFLHQSIAEYLAADARFRTVDDEAVYKELADPTRRSLALFTLARKGKSVAPVVASLLASGDALIAGHVLAEGFAVDDNLVQSVLEALLNHIREEDASAVECLGVLTELASDQRIRSQLVSVVENPLESPWTRALIADGLTELYPDLGTRLLREVATDRRTDNDASRIWAAQRLVTRGDEFANRIKREIGNGTPQQSRSEGRLAEHAMHTIALDPRTAPRARVELAADLYDGGDLVGMEILRQVAWDPALDVSERRIAAQLMMERGDADGRSVLENIAKKKEAGESERRMAAVLLSSDDSQVESTVLRERARDRGLSLWQRRMAAEQLARRQDPVGYSVLRSFVDDDQADPFERYESAVALAYFGDSVGVDYLELISQDNRAGYDERYSAATALAQSDRKGGATALEKLAMSQDVDPWERRMAAQVLFFETGSEISTDALFWIAQDKNIPRDERYEAARVLCESGRAEGFEVLRELASQSDMEFRVRYNSALVLVKQGDRTGFEVLRFLATGAAYMTDDRRLAARILAEYRDEIGLTALREFAGNRHLDPAERRQAALALAKLGDSEGIQTLQELLDS